MQCRSRKVDHVDVHISRTCVQTIRVVSILVLKLGEFI